MSELANPIAQDSHAAPADFVSRLRARPEVEFFRTLFRASPGLAAAWWLLNVLRGVLPALLALASSALIHAIAVRSPLAESLTAVGVVFVAFQVLSPIHQAVSSNLGNVAAAWMNEPRHDDCSHFGTPVDMGRPSRPALP